jgi:Ca-activated chloride channel family protein
MKSQSPLAKHLILSALLCVGLTACDGCDSNPQADPASAPEASTGETWPGNLPADATVEPIERRTAANYYIVFDGSGSMDEAKCSGTEKKIDIAKRAFQEFAATIPGSANVGLAVFDEDGLNERLPLTQQGGNRAGQLVQQVAPGGGTPLQASVLLGKEKLKYQAARQLGYGEYHLVIVTDGEASKGQDPSDAVNALLAESPILVHTVGFCLGEDHSLNQAGRVYYQAADNPEELKKGLSEVLAEAPAFSVDAFKKTQ